jgi:hypothetical protein
MSQVRVREMNGSEPIDDMSKFIRRCQNRGAGASPGKSRRPNLCVVLLRQPALRRHEPYLGFGMEQGRTSGTTC